jgi:hypothetical protein
MVDDNTKKSRSRMWKTGVIKIRERERKVDFYFRSQKKKKEIYFCPYAIGSP